MTPECTINAFFRPQFLSAKHTSPKNQMKTVWTIKLLSCSTEFMIHFLSEFVRIPLVHKLSRMPV